MDSKSFYAILIPFLTLLISCSKDEPDTTFEGIWIKQADARRNCTDPSKNSAKDGDFIFDTPCTDEPRFLCGYEKYVFDNGTFKKSSSTAFFGIPLSFSDEGSYSISGTTLTICEEFSSGEQECKNLEYSINGNTISLAFKNAETGCLEIDYYLKQ